MALDKRWHKIVKNPKLSANENGILYLVFDVHRHASLFDAIVRGDMDSLCHV